MTPTRQETREFEDRVMDAFDQGNCPMSSVHNLCHRMGECNVRSNSKFYVKVYRTLERLVEQEKAWVMRGVRDPSVYMLKRSAKGFDSNGVQDIPF